jgi:serine/threonine protein kinase/Flp pilus assembly protein TadD
MRVLEQGVQLAGRYTLVRRLGSGGMSETWLAQDRQTGKSVALKFLSSGLSDNAGYRKLFRKEWQLGSRLMHANIVRVFEYHDDTDGPYFSLQYIGGPNLAVLTGEDIEFVLRPIGLIADALRYTHAKNVVHRDLKAANVLLDNRGAPYLIDFGVAAHPGQDHAATGGSLVAASPQQIAGELPKPEDDVYSLGVLIYELISGGPPWHGAPEDRLGKEPRPLQAKNGEPVPASIDALVTEMLARNVALRPDAEAVSERLRDAGFDPGMVPRRFTSAAENVDAISADHPETIRPVERRARPHTTASVKPQQKTGISPRMLGISLAAALVLFLAVVFVLPKIIGYRDDISSESAATTPSPQRELPDADDNVPFNENIDEFLTRDERVLLKQEAEQALGELLSKLDTLEVRAVGRWGGQVLIDAQEVYAAGDSAYLRKNYRLAGEKYREAIVIIDPLLDRVDIVFEETMLAARVAVEAGDSMEALRHYELAVAISPGHAEAHNGLARAKNLDLVMSLTKQGADHERDLDLDAARVAFEKALELDPEWQPAEDGVQRVLLALNQMSFDQRMTEGLEALADGDFPTARAAFRTAQALQPESREPADGLLQVDQGIRLQKIAALENQAKKLEGTEQWEAAVQQYNAILQVDSDLVFAHEGLARASDRSALHKTLEGYIAEPDSLSEPSTMQAATKMLLDITRMSSVGPRLEDQKNQLSRLLKRAVTPLTVRLVSDNATDVVIFRVGKLGSFDSQEISLRPGTYVAVGSRPGYRDVRLEFRVSPEIELQPIVVRCEETI